MKIRLLDSQTAAKIAAGEIITESAAVVKELVENSIDANARNIIIEIKNGGKSLIRVIDDGDGIEDNDIERAFLRHGTSKIQRLDDLEKLETLGFRGEALASMAAVSKISVRTSIDDSGIGIKYDLIEGNSKSAKISCSKGTAISIQELFYNTPARLKHMKKEGEENRKIIKIIQILAMSQPSISLSLSLDGVQILKTPGDDRLANTLASIYGSEFIKSVYESSYVNTPLQIKGFLGKPYFSKKNRDYQHIFINGRYVNENKINKAIEDAYDNTLMINQHPVFILDIKIPTYMLDVNVHPAKTKVKILNESLVFLLLKDGIRKIIKENFNKKEVDQTDLKKESYFKIREENSFNYLSTPETPTELNKPDKDHEVGNRENVTINEMSKTQKSDPIDLFRSVDTDGERQIDNIFRGTTIKGQLFKTYIMLERNQDELVMIDQHAAHERIIYEDLMKNTQKSEKNTQTIIPVKFELAKEKINFLKDNRSTFSDMGFDFELFGSDSIVVRSVPVLLGKPVEGHVLKYILEDERVGLKSDLKSQLIMSACKKAIKANKEITEKEIQNLIESLKKCEIPFTCPHGRPIIISISKYEMEKLFKRVT
ncbi:DNA mismatch repair endonuclease MutL [Alkalibacter mobilis]|uniref:DNA mismatch repair endonuclease MutL n=1 Tax=Alkalibacter mobilis TaxID=2787712 RepID=UPI00189D716D|nr:DNA mismatch repair endonuclease MutL [Alkalibacter mobilis]MBF7097622.1 DNA mismatch repair endonuclease MutL [Alkalibacter mobilis]